MRRLLGPVGGPFMFFLIAALVFTGLGWVTVAALRVEDAQREAAAQAQLNSNLRIALRDLDSRVLPVLGVEDSRPFYHYTSADPLSGSTAGPTPLLGAQLPEWMKIHIQLDPIGWESPQVLSPDAAHRVSIAWPDLPLRNNTAERTAYLHALRHKYPAPSVCDLLAARERAAPGDPRPFAPWFDPAYPAVEATAFAPPPDSLPKPPPPPEMNPSGTPDSLKIFGWELSRRDAITGNPSNGTNDAAAQNVQPAPAPTPKPPAFPPVAAPDGGAVGRGTFPLTEKERQWLDLRNRIGPISRGVQEARNAGQEFYGRNGPTQNLTNPNNTNVAPSTTGTKDGKDKVQPGTDKQKAENLKQRMLDTLNQFQVEQYRGSLFGRFASVGLGLERQRCLEEIQNAIDAHRKRAAREDDLVFAIAWVWRIAMSATGSEPVPVPRPVPPASERPVPATPNVIAAPLNPLNGLPATSIHLGSMRPQWITAADGTETLVLIRVAKIDNKTVYQGVVLDWVKLQQMLKDEVKEMFPDAKLVGVKDPADVSPDRAMTALPVHLDPGPAPALPRAGWTPLRFGLVLAWVAALVAFAAVGFSGWSLIDLAERRIRFVSAVTHELRTPLTSLRLYLDLLMSGMIHDEAKRQEYLATLALESDRLHRLVDNVLDFAKLEKRAKNGDMKPINVRDLLAMLERTWVDRLAADGKELIVISTLPYETEVVTDLAMVQQIVGNLLDNARKYTRDAEDKRIWLWAKPGGNGRVVFEVEDRGAGVPQSERKTIFKPFRRGGQADARAGGAGLGLALAQQWAQVLGGTVAYRPADGAPGACFRLELPMKV